MFAKTPGHLAAGDSTSVRVETREKESREKDETIRTCASDNGSRCAAETPTEAQDSVGAAFVGGISDDRYAAAGDTDSACEDALGETDSDSLPHRRICPLTVFPIGRLGVHLSPLLPSSGEISWASAG